MTRLVPNNAISVINPSTQTQAPTFSPVGGSYGPPQTVAIHSLTPGASFYYTLDGSAPTTSSPLYTAPLFVAVSLTLRAIAVAPGLSTSSISTTAYTISPGLTISINATGQFIDGSGTIINLRGTSVGGTGYVNGGTNFWTAEGWPSTIDITTLRTSYKGNVVRFTISQACVLGQTVLVLSTCLPSGTPGSFAGAYTVYNLPSTLPSYAVSVNCDADGQFTAKLKSAVDAFTAAGFYVILDLHFTAPDVIINGVTYHVHNNGSSAQQCMPDAVQGPAAIAKLATQYAGYNNVIIECYNEPGSASGLNWSGWKSGAAQTKIAVQDYTSTINQGIYYDFAYSWTNADMQQLVTAARSGTGFLGPLLLGGIEYGSELGNNGFADNTSTWLLSMPTDPANKLVASLHCYPGSAYSTSGNYYRYCASDNNPSVQGYRQWVAWVNAINAANIPCIIGEYGGDGSTTDSIEPFVSDLLAQVDAINTAKQGSLGALFWAYTSAYGVGGGTAITINPSTGVASPAGRTGKVAYNWMSGHAAP